MRKIWTKPALINLSNKAVKSGGAGPARYENYINNGTYAPGDYPCVITAGGDFATTSWYTNTTGIACQSIGACDQIATPITAGGSNLSATANCS